MVELADLSRTTVEVEAAGGGVARPFASARMLDAESALIESVVALGEGV